MSPQKVSDFIHTIELYNLCLRQKVIQSVITLKGFYILLQWKEWFKKKWKKLYTTWSNGNDVLFIGIKIIEFYYI